jgi:hypothetical protein
VPEEFKPRIGQQMDDVLLPPRKQIIETDDLMTVADQSITEVAAQKSGTTGYEDAHDLEGRKLPVESRKKSGRRLEGDRHQLNRFERRSVHDHLFRRVAQHEWVQTLHADFRAQ